MFDLHLQMGVQNWNLGHGGVMSAFFLALSRKIFA
jgi:hypothetical protein